MRRPTNTEAETHVVLFTAGFLGRGFDSRRLHQILRTRIPRAKVLAGMSTQARVPVTPEQYLELERKAEHKSEYFAGEMFAMAGAPEAHNILVMNMAGLIYLQFRQRNCRVYGSDMRVNVSSTGLYTYPDVSALCGEPHFLDQRRDTLLNPSVIVEVLSSSTEAYDRGRKFEHYRAVPTLVQYVLVASDRVHVDVYTRDAAGKWVLTSFAKPDDHIELGSIEVQFKVSELYEKTDLVRDGEESARPS